MPSLSHCIQLSELARCQSNLTDLSRLLQSLEILQRTQSAPNFTDMQVKQMRVHMHVHREPAHALMQRVGRMFSVSVKGLSAGQCTLSLSLCMCLEVLKSPYYSGGGPVLKSQQLLINYGVTFHSLHSPVNFVFATHLWECWLFL